MSIPATGSTGSGDADRPTVNAPAVDALQRPLKLAVLAIGGQGGGVLTDWLVALAERNGWRAQSTSVPGVAQRTGATVYYVEMIPESASVPVLALMPSPGDVDVVISAELMEAGRAIQRGLVSPDRTTLVSSTHRAYAVSEKMVPGDGTADSSVVLGAAREMSKRFVSADMSAIAERHGSVISASLFGAVAGAGVLPFERATFEATISDGGVGVAASLAAFAGGFEAIADPVAITTPGVAPTVDAAGLVGGSTAERALYEACRTRIALEVPEPVRAIAHAGLDACIDFQDAAYGEEYLDAVLEMLALERRATGASGDALATPDLALTREAAKYVARAMVYDDVIRVADLKTRESRFERVAAHAGTGVQDLLHVTEYMHPRVEEVCGTLPAGLGGFVERSPLLVRLLRPLVDRPRRVRTDSLPGFLLLYAVAGLRRFRRRSLRDTRERDHRTAWMALARDVAEQDLPLAVEVIRCRRLVKGYSDTHSRGLGKYDRVIGAVTALIGREDSAACLQRLREAALADEDGEALDRELAGLAPTTH